jgi:hypothetical protein
VCHPRRSLVSAVLSLALPGAVILIAHFEGNLVNRGLDLDVSRDLGFFAQYFILLPMTFFGIGMLVARFPVKLVEWTQAGHLTAALNDHVDVVSWANRWFASRITRGAPLVIALTALVYGASMHTFSPRNTWHSPTDVPFGTAAGLAILPIRFLLYFAVADFAVRTAISLTAYARLVKLGLRVQIRHSDSCGGLSSLGRYWIGTYVSILAVGFVFWVLVYTIQVRVWHGSASYVLVLVVYGVALVLGLIPLLVTHHAMAKERRERLAPLDESIHTATGRLMANGFGAQESTELDRLLKVRGIMETMAVWPYDFRFLSVLTATLIPGVISLLKLSEAISTILSAR